VLHVGQTFFNEPGPDVPRHLWIVLSDPAAAPQVALVNVSSVPADLCTHDPTTIEAREIPAVNYRSYVRCDKARLAVVNQLDQAERKGLIQPSQPASAAVLERARRAVGECSFVPNELKDLLRSQGSL
jgi:hypothetical protein